jgi:hypothetical protein
MELDATGLKTTLPNLAITVKDPQYAAQGDGVTDDTAAFTAAAAAAANKILRVPPGTYIVSSLTLGDIQVEGDRATIKQKASTSGHLVNVTGNARFRGVTFDGGSQASESTNVLIRATGDDTSVECVGCRFLTPAYSAISVIGDNTDTSFEVLRVQGCDFIGGAQGSDTYACRYISVTDGAETTVRDCVFDLDASAVNGRAGIVVDQSQTATPHFSKVNITGNTFRNLGLDVSAPLGVIDLYIWAEGFVCNNRFVSSNITPIKTKSNLKNLLIDGNSIDTVDSGNPGVSINNSTTSDSNDRAIITNNTVTGVTNAAAISCSGLTGSDYQESVLVANNNIGSCQIGIDFSQCKNGAARGNQIKGNTGVAIRLINSVGAWAFQNNATVDSPNVSVYVTSSDTSSGIISGNLINGQTSGYCIAVEGGDVWKISNNLILGASSANGISVAVSGKTVALADIQCNTIQGTIGTAVALTPSGGTVAYANVANNTATTAGTEISSGSGTVTTLREFGNSWNP